MNRREALAALMSLPATATLSAATVATNDVIVLESDELLSASDCARLEHMLLQIWPGRKVAVLSRGMKLKIVRQA